MEYPSSEYTLWVVCLKTKKWKVYDVNKWHNDGQRTLPSGWLKKRKVEFMKQAASSQR